MFICKECHEGQPFINALIKAVKQSHPRCVKSLIDAKVNVNIIRIKNHYRNRVLLEAFEVNNPDIINLLIQAGAYIDFKSNYSALCDAAKYNCLESIDTLIAAGADLNGTDYNEHTPLIIALENENFDFAKLLIEKGANVNKQDEDSFEIIYPSPLCHSIIYNCFEIAKIIIKHGVDVNDVSEEEKTPLIHLVNCEKPDLDLIELLIKAGADINKPDAIGKTPLIHSLKYMETDRNVTELLIKAGADVNVPDYNGKTPLIHLVKWEKLDQNLIDLLIKAGADINKPGKKGRTPLIHSVGYEEPD